MTEGREKIVDGLKDAAAFARGEDVGARVTHYPARGIEDHIKALKGRIPQSELGIKLRVCEVHDTLHLAADTVDALEWLLADARRRVDWLEGLFDFSDPELVLNSAPNDPVTKDAVVVLRSHYEGRRTEQPPVASPTISFLRELGDLSRKYKLAMSGEPVLFEMEPADMYLEYRADDNSVVSFG